MAAVITPSVVQNADINSNNTYGATERRLKVAFFSGTKATQSDWFLASTYIPTDYLYIIGALGWTEVSAGTSAVDAVTYDSDDAKVTLTSSDTGTSYALVFYYTK